MSERPERTEAVAPGRGAESEFLVENDDALAALVNLIAVIGDNVSSWAAASPSGLMPVRCWNLQLLARP